MLVERAVHGLHESLAAKVADLPRDIAILDLGCGTGAWVARLRTMGFTNVMGVDLDPPAGFIRADLEKPLVLDRRFGLITAIEVIEHLGAPGALLSSASKLLEPNGALLLTTPNTHSLRSRLRFALTGNLPSFDGKGDPTHVLPINLVGLKRLAHRCGLVIAETWTYPERGSHIFGPAIKAAASIAGLVLPDPLPGDNLCVMLRSPGVPRHTS